MNSTRNERLPNELWEAAQLKAGEDIADALVRIRALLGAAEGSGVAAKSSDEPVGPVGTGKHCVIAGPQAVYAYRRRGLDEFVTCSRERFEELGAKPNLFETRIFSSVPVAPPVKAVSSDNDLRRQWKAAGGKFHGPNIETGTMPEADLLPFLRRLSAADESSGKERFVTYQSLLRALQEAHVRVSGSAEEGWRILLPQSEVGERLVMGYFVDWPDEPDLGFSYAESFVVGARNRALVFRDEASEVVERPGEQNEPIRSSAGFDADEKIRTVVRSTPAGYFNPNQQGQLINRDAVAELVPVNDGRALDWESLEEDPGERSMFDDNLGRLYNNDPRLAVATTLRLWGRTMQQGSFGQVCSVLANEVAKMYLVAPPEVIKDNEALSRCEEQGRKGDAGNFQSLTRALQDAHVGVFGNAEDGWRVKLPEPLTNVEPVAVVDADDDNMWADILPDRDVKIGQKLYAALVVEQPNTQDREDAQKYRRLHTPEVVDFLSAVENEALFQRERWSEAGDAGKTDADWFWLVGYLAGKAIRPDGTDKKRLHHIITTAAACLNWHAARVGAYTKMRPGIEGPEAVQANQEKTHD